MMHINERTAISTSKVLLVPYEAHHVPTYHEWMKDPEIQALTASEPLSLEEEYTMQKSWRKDRDKLTFIICLPLPVSVPVTVASSTSPAIPATSTTQPPSSEALSPPPPTPPTHPNQMIGDINLFLSPSDEEATPSRTCIGEIELMIAPLAARKKGYGRAALLTFLRYIFLHLGDILEEYSDIYTNRHTEINQESTKSGEVFRLESLRVKIDRENVASIRLFESVGFLLVDGGKVNWFGEVEGVLAVDGVDGVGEGIEELLGRWGVEGWREVEYGDLGGERSV